MHRPVGRHDVGAAGVKTVDLAQIGAVDRARTRTRAGLRIETLDANGIGTGSPGAARTVRIGNDLSHVPALRPPGGLRNQEGVGGAVLNVRDPRRLRGRSTKIALAAHDAAKVCRVNQSEHYECLSNRLSRGVIGAGAEADIFGCGS